MQLQTQVPRRDWSSAAASSIPQPRLVPLMEWKKKKPTHRATSRQIRQTFAADKTLIKKYEAVLLINNIGD